MSLDPVLEWLEEAQLVRRLPDSEPAYMFKHILTQETAYQSLLARRRRQIHRWVAEAYEELYPDRLGEFAALLAQHYGESGDDAKTLEYSRQAGDAALRVHALAEGLMHYDRALDIALRMAEGKNDVEAGALLKQLYLKRGRAYELSARWNDALANYEAMEALSYRRGDPALELSAIIARAMIHTTYTARHYPERARELLERGLALAAEMADREAEAKVLWTLSLLHTFSGQSLHAITYGERSLAIARALDLREQMAYALNDLVRPYLVAGRPEEARRSAEEARDLWRELANGPMIAENLTNLGFCHYCAGEYVAAIVLITEAAQMNAAMGNAWGEAYSQRLAGYVYYEVGDLGKGLQVLEATITLGKQAGFLGYTEGVEPTLPFILGTLGAIDEGIIMARLAHSRERGLRADYRQWVPATLARLYILKGDLEEAARFVEQSRNMAWEPGFFSLAPYFALLAEGELELARGNHAQALAVAEKIVRLLSDTKIRPLLSDSLYLKASALLALERPWEALETLSEARAEAEARQARRMLWPILAMMADLEERLRENLGEAAALRQRACELIQYIAGGLPPHLRRSFLAQLEVQALIVKCDLGQGA